MTFVPETAELGAVLLVGYGVIRAWRLAKSLIWGSF